MTTPVRSVGFWLAALPLFCLTGPPMIFIVAIVRSYFEGQPNDFATLPMGWFIPVASTQPYLFWCAYFLIRHLLPWKMSPGEHVVILLVTAVGWVMASTMTMQAMIEAYDYREPYEPFHVLLLPTVAPWYLVQYAVANRLWESVTRIGGTRHA